MGLGYDLRGVMYWSLVDNFEWAFGFSMRVRAWLSGRAEWGRWLLHWWCARAVSPEATGKLAAPLASPCGCAPGWLLASAWRAAWRPLVACLAAPSATPRAAPRPTAHPHHWQFGVYRWENDGSQERKPHASAALLKRWYQRLPGRVAELLRRVPRRVPAGLEDGAGEEEAAAAPLLQPAAA